MLLTPAMAALVALEEQVADAVEAATPNDRPRVYEWQPSSLPQLPAIWNWIDDGEHEIPDTGREDDLIVVTATIGVRPSDMGETMGRLTRLTDHFRVVVDPALKTRPVLGGTVRTARRVLTRTNTVWFPSQGGGEVPVMCMDMLIRLQLSHFTG